MLSIIIPHYNSVQSLTKLLNSIPKRNDIEIIVVDDKSNKDLNQFDRIKNSFQYSHVKFLKNSTNEKGAGVCRNIGLNKATGKWVLFADSDDFFVDGFYSKVKKYFCSDYDVVFFTPTSIDAQKGTVSDRHIVYEKYIKNLIYKKDIKSELSLRYKFHVPWSKLIKLSFLKENNILFQRVIASNDVMFSVQLGYYMKKFKVSEEIIYCVTKNKGSLTVNTSEKVFDARVSVHVDYVTFLKEKLDKKELKLLNVKGGMGFLVSALRYRLGFRKVISTYLFFKKSKVHVFDLRYLDPIYLGKRILFQYKIIKRDREYLKRV